MTAERPQTTGVPDAFIERVARCTACTLSFSIWPHLNFCAEVHEPELKAWLAREFRTEAAEHGPCGAGEGAGS